MFCQLVFWFEIECIMTLNEWFLVGLSGVIIVAIKVYRLGIWGSSSVFVTHAVFDVLESIDIFGNEIVQFSHPH